MDRRDDIHHVPNNVKVNRLYRTNYSGALGREELNVSSRRFPLSGCAALHVTHNGWDDFTQ
jgi:hypothetical protein